MLPIARVNGQWPVQSPKSKKRKKRGVKNSQQKVLNIVRELNRNQLLLWWLFMPLIQTVIVYSKKTTQRKNNPLMIPPPKPHAIQITTNLRSLFRCL